MLDEVQTLAEGPDGAGVVATLRAVLHQRRREIFAVFTGSSQEGLARLMNAAGAPMYQFTQMLSFPVLGDDFLGLLAEHFRAVHPAKRLNIEKLHDLFQAIGCRPALMRDIVRAMSAEGITDTQVGLDRYLNADQQVASWNALLPSASGPPCQ
jgi:hypothetical protein